MDYSRRLVLASITILIVCFSSVFSVIAIDWGTYQKDESRNGFSMDNIKLPLKLDYEINIGAELTGGILVNGNNFFFTTKSGMVGSGSSFTGTINWERTLGEEIQSCAVLSEYDIFVATIKGTLFCISQKTGAIIWRTSLGKPVSIPLLKVYQFIYIAHGDGKIDCVNALDGLVIWTTDLSEEIGSAICYKNNVIYAVTTKGQIASIDAQNGKKYWNYFVGSTSHSPPIVGTEAIYFGDDKGNLYCFDYVSGKQYWVKKQTAAFISPMAFAYFDKRVLIAGLADRYIGITTGNGNEMWSYPSSATSVAPISAGRQLFLQGSNQNFVVLDSFDGKELYSYPLKANITNGMAISNGKIFLGTKTSIILFSSSMNDFQIDITPSIQTISPGGSGKFEINVQASQSFTDTISFSVIGFPCSCKGITRNFDETIINTPKKVTLTLDVSLEAVAARYDISIQAFSGNDLVRKAYAVVEITGQKNNTSLNIQKPEGPLKAWQDFSLDINLNDATEVKSVSFMLEYPKDSLYVRDITIGNFFKGESVNLVFDKSIQNEKGNLVIGYSRKDAVDSGSGLIARIVFKAMKPGTHKIKFTKYSVRDTFFREMLTLLNDKELTVNPGVQKKIVMIINKKTMLIDGKTYQLDSPPVIEKGRTLIPIRVIAENLESRVLWEDKEQKITILHFTKRIELWINKTKCFVNGIEKDMPSNVPPRILYNRTYVPLKFIADELDASVLWEAKTQTITILYPN